MTTRMWEAVAAAGKVDELVAWAVQHAPPDAQVYRSADDRVVVIDPTGAGLPDAPAALLSRPPHTWDFEPVRR
jgi:hypothetical protein